MSPHLKFAIPLKSLSLPFLSLSGSPYLPHSLSLGPNPAHSLKRSISSKLLFVRFISERFIAQKGCPRPFLLVFVVINFLLLWKTLKKNNLKERFISQFQRAQSTTGPKSGTSQGKSVAEANCLHHGSWEAERKSERKRPGTRHTLHRHSLAASCFHLGSTLDDDSPFTYVFIT